MNLKFLSTTGIAIALGLTSLGINVTPMYAAIDTEILSATSERIVTTATVDSDIENNKELYSKHNMFHFSSSSTTGFKITSENKKLESIDYAVNDNSENPDPSTRKSAIKAYSTTDSLTLNASAEISVGAEMSISAKIPGIADVTSKITPGFKVSPGISKISSEMKSLTYGGDALEAQPHEIVRVDYYLERLSTSGVMNSGTRIIEIGDNLNISPFYGITEEGTYKYGENLILGANTGEGIYITFKKLEEINNEQALVTANEGEGERVAWRAIPKNYLSNLFFIDDIAKTVSTVESQANFDGVSRAGLTMKTSVVDSTKNMIVTSGLKNILQ